MNNDHRHTTGPDGGSMNVELACRSCSWRHTVTERDNGWSLFGTAGAVMAKHEHPDATYIDFDKMEARSD